MSSATMAFHNAFAKLAGDPYFSSVSALLQFDGANGSNVYIDAKGSAWSSYTGAALISTAQSKFGGSSLLLSASSQSLSTPDDAKFDFGAGDFTIEAWVQQSTSDIANYHCVLSHDDTSATRGWILLVFAATGIMRLQCFVGSTPFNVFDSAVLTQNQWYFFAVVRDGGTLRMYRDGVQTGTTAISGAINAPAQPMRIGTLQNAGTPNGPTYFNGYIDDVRITKGVCRYPGGTTFTPPIQAFPGPADPSFSTVVSLLHFNGTNGSTTFTDQIGSTTWTATNATLNTTTKKYGTAAGSFNGSNTVISAPYSSGYDFGSGDFDIELWINPTALPGATDSNFIMVADDTGGGGHPRGWQLGLQNGTGKVFFALVQSGSFVGVVFSTAAPSTAAWTHVCAERFGNVVTLYINGTSVATAAVSGAMDSCSPNRLAIGTIYASGAPSGTATRYFNGFLDDLRITKGVSRYRGNFTPPVLPYPDF